MKKTLIALAAVAVSGAAFAQATITGSIAFSLQTTAKDQTNRLDLSDADINFAASEDLGGGMKASVSTSISNEKLRGGSTDANNTTIALSGAFGTISYVNVLSGQSKLSIGASLEDDMSDAMGGYGKVNVLDYTLPSFIPNTSLTLEWAAVQDTNMELAGEPALIANYATGPLKVYAEFATDGSAAWDIRPSYDLGVAKVSFRATKSKKQEFAVTAPLGAMTVGLQYGKGAALTNGYVGKATAVAASYALSKRTSVTASYLTGDVAAGADTYQGTSKNYRLQLKHTF
jgi:predicted porin